MSFRRKMSRSKSKRSFRRGAMHIKSRNTFASPMRGGIRI
jgi:hypothetical protein|nr:MAG: DNA binding protein [Microviridae sp.]